MRKYEDHISALLNKFTVGDGCWEWQARKDSAGYGLYWLGGASKRKLMAHRAVWMLFRGEIPDELTIDHLCLNKSCVRPSHLEVVTRAENSRRQGARKEIHA